MPINFRFYTCVAKPTVRIPSPFHLRSSINKEAKSKKPTKKLGLTTCIATQADAQVPQFQRRSVSRDFSQKKTGKKN